MTTPDPKAPEPMTRDELLERLQKHLITATLAISDDPKEADLIFRVMRRMIDETARAWGEVE